MLLIGVGRTLRFSKGHSAPLNFVVSRASTTLNGTLLIDPKKRHLKPQIGSRRICGFLFQNGLGCENLNEGRSTIPTSASSSSNGVDFSIDSYSTLPMSGCFHVLHFFPCICGRIILPGFRLHPSPIIEEFSPEGIEFSIYDCGS